MHIGLRDVSGLAMVDRLRLLVGSRSARLSATRLISPHYCLEQNIFPVATSLII
jgi:hypothetical protein